MSYLDRSDEDEMRAALQVAVARICTSEDASKHDGAQMTSSAIRTLTELTFLYATTNLANDLVAFSQHASRRTITPDDVLLVARKNPDNLVAKMKDFEASAGLVTTVAVTAGSKTNKAEALISVVSRKKPSLSSSSSTSSSFRRQLRERLLQGTDSENSSNDSNNDDINYKAKRKKGTSNNALLETDGDDNNVTLGVSKRQKRTPSFAKRKVIETDSSDENDQALTAQSKKKGKDISITKPTTTNLSSDDDSSDF